jgi:hypothetical protein
MEPPLIEALSEGMVRSRRVDHTTNRTSELDAAFWRDGGARWKKGRIPVEIHRKDLLEWLTPGAKTNGSRKQGRPATYDWDAFWIEVVNLANHPDGLPDTQAALADHIETWFEEEIGKSPARSEIEARISRLYNRIKPGN